MGCSSSSQKNDVLSANSSLSHNLSKATVLQREAALTLAKELFDATKHERFHSNYIRPTLSSYGANCKVLTCYSKKTGQKLAAKTIPKDLRRPEQQYHLVLNEVGIMKAMEDHPNAVKLLEVYDEPKSYYLVMECCEGGELFEHITKAKEGFTERQAAKILRGLMQFLNHMHSRGMAHMDIKPENIMFDSEGAGGILKVLDFGSSVHLQSDEQVRDAFGTVRYSSPEMANDTGIGQKTDIWSAGVVMYFMLSGQAPFLKSSDIDTLNYIKKCPRVKFSGARWNGISTAAKDCIRAMLEPDPSVRPSAAAVLQMTWVRSSHGPDNTIRSDTLDNLRAFASQSRMRRLLLGLIAANLSGTEANRLLSEFYMVDLDSSGTIEVQELVEAARKALPDVSEEEVRRVFQALDIDGTGTVDVKEFFAGLLHTMDTEIRAALAKKSFSALDTSHLGYVTRDVFVQALVNQAKASGLCPTDLDEKQLFRDLEAEFKSLDANNDGVLSLEEFKAALGLAMHPEGAPLPQASSSAHLTDANANIRPSSNAGAAPVAGRLDTSKVVQVLSSRTSSITAATSQPGSTTNVNRTPSNRILSTTPPDPEAFSDYTGHIADSAIQSHQNLIRLALEITERARSHKRTGSMGPGLTGSSSTGSHRRQGSSGVGARILESLRLHPSRTASGAVRTMSGRNATRELARTSNTAGKEGGPISPTGDDASNRGASRPVSTTFGTAPLSRLLYPATDPAGIALASSAGGMSYHRSSLASNVGPLAAVAHLLERSGRDSPQLTSQNGHSDVHRSRSARTNEEAAAADQPLKLLTSSHHGPTIFTSTSSRFTDTQLSPSSYVPSLPTVLSIAGPTTGDGGVSAGSGDVQLQSAVGSVKSAGTGSGGGVQPIAPLVPASNFKQVGSNRSVNWAPPEGSSRLQRSTSQSQVQLEGLAAAPSPDRHTSDVGVPTLPSPSSRGMEPTTPSSYLQPQAEADAQMGASSSLIHMGGSTSSRDAHTSDHGARSSAVRQSAAGIADEGSGTPGQPDVVSGVPRCGSGGRSSSGAPRSSSLGRSTALGRSPSLKDKDKDKGSPSQGGPTTTSSTSVSRHNSSKRGGDTAATSPSPGSGNSPSRVPVPGASVAAERVPSAASDDLGGQPDNSKAGLNPSRANSGRQTVVA